MVKVAESGSSRSKEQREILEILKKRGFKAGDGVLGNRMFTLKLMLDFPTKAQRAPYLKAYEELKAEGLFDDKDKLTKKGAEVVSKF